MSTPEILVRLLLGAVFILLAVAVLLPVLSERHQLAAVLVLAAGGTVVLIGVGWHMRGRRG